MLNTIPQGNTRVSDAEAPSRAIALPGHLSHSPSESTTPPRILRRDKPSVVVRTIPRTGAAPASAVARMRVSLLKWDRRVELCGGQWLKRAMDMTAAASALIFLSPLLAVIAACIKLHDGGTVLFWQTRVGRHGQTFAFPKFRSMRIDAERLKAKLLQQNDHGDSITFKMKDDPRITPIGKLLRRFSLDELPQLWCVLIGDMSLVGPRPAVPSEVEQYTPFHRQRLKAHPGLTCVWQVSGRGELSFEQQVLLDLEYIQTQSIWTDIWLIAKTVPAVLIGRGAY